ncbi:MAG: hypothetical protein KGH87_07165 [Thaumarchaeota archaeon]|nr:hypothetical protein [Nitrososphaerota archaeon]
MEFRLYDTFETYKKHNPIRNDPFMENEIYKTFITKNGNFWFFTHMQYPQHVLDINKPYVHFHDGIDNLNELSSECEQVKKYEWFYNYSANRIEAKPSKILFWKKPRYVKKVTYWGKTIQEKRVPCNGKWYYDSTMDRIVIILNYTPKPKQPDYRMGYEIPVKSV